MTTLINPILAEILQTRRPTKDPRQNATFCAELLKALRIKHVVDKYLNITVSVGDSDTCFTAHTDTVDNRLGINTLLIQDSVVTVADGGVLGADCGSGMYILIRMIQERVPGHYVFFATEEQGRIGSRCYAMPGHVAKCISFDRRDEGQLITHQMGEQGCSPEFAKAFTDAFALPFVADPTGAFTDSYSFFGSVQECVNLSVGYHDQHTKFESQDVGYLESMVEACIRIDWASLPAKRNPRKDACTWITGFCGDIDDIDDLDDLDQLVYDYPETASNLLAAYGISADDFMLELDRLNRQEFKRKMGNW